MGDQVELKVHLSQLRPPEGALGLIESSTRQLINGIAPSSWLDCSLVDSLLRQHPIVVCQAEKHFVVVRGFKSFHLVSSVCRPDQLVLAKESSESAEEQVRCALFELISNSLMFSLDAVACRKQLYKSLRALAVQLSQDYDCKTPKVITPRSLRELLGLSLNQTKAPSVRHSELSRLVRKFGD